MAARKWLPSLFKSAPITRLRKFGRSITPKLKGNYRKTVLFARKKPFTSFFVSLAILLLVIILGSTIFRTVPPKIESRSNPKNVTVYSLSDLPRITLQGEVKKGGVVNIVAQSPGIVNSINKNEGETVGKGTVILNLSSNYQGDNAPTFQRQLAGVTYQNTKETYNTQKNLIQRQADLANRQVENAQGLREITQFSIESTRTLVNLNGEMLKGVVSSLQNLESSGGEEAQIQQLRQAQAQLQAANLQLETQLRSNEYQINENNPPRDLERINRDIALGQLDIQRKALEMGLRVAGIQFQLAKIQESLMFPASPFAGTVERVNVKVGDSVNPGTVLATVSSGEGDIVINVDVPKTTAEKISKTQKAVINIGEKNIEIAPAYISKEATSGQLFSVKFALGNLYNNLFTDKSFVSVSIPLINTFKNSTILIPLDSVFQTQEVASVYVVEKNKAKSKKVKLGKVSGGFVEVKEGLTLKDKVITTRNVIDGDNIKTIN